MSGKYAKAPSCNLFYGVYRARVSIRRNELRYLQQRGASDHDQAYKKDGAAIGEIEEYPEDGESGTALDTRPIRKTRPDFDRRDAYVGNARQQSPCRYSGVSLQRCNPSVEFAHMLNNQHFRRASTARSVQVNS